MNSICLFTVIYPGCEPFLKRFFESANNQTVEAFDLVILNDGLENAEKLIPIDKARVQLHPVNGTIAKVREKGLKFLINSEYEKVVFSDADDYISNSRVESALNALENADIYVNDLSIVNSDGEVSLTKYFSKRLDNEFIINKEFILQKNILGLGNTSVRRGALREISIPESTIAVDWLIFTDMLLRGCSAKFENNSITFYRQHESNTVGFNKISAERVEQALRVQLQNAGYFADSSEQYQNHLNRLQKLKKYLSEDQQNMQEYLNKLESLLPEYPFWWEEVKTLDQITI